MRTCPLDEFQCNNTLCKPLAWKCDGEDDCGDNSDENPEECGEAHGWGRGFGQGGAPRRGRGFYRDVGGVLTHLPTPPPPPLPATADSDLSPLAAAARFVCPPNRPFRCKNDRVCLWIGRQCDGTDNCGDGTDEEDCGEQGASKGEPGAPRVGVLQAVGLGQVGSSSVEPIDRERGGSTAGSLEALSCWERSP